MHFVNEKRFVWSVIWDEKDAPLEVVKRESCALLLGHEVCELSLVMDVGNYGHSLIH